MQEIYKNESSINIKIEVTKFDNSSLGFIESIYECKLLVNATKFMSTRTGLSCTLCFSITTCSILIGLKTKLYQTSINITGHNAASFKYA